MHSPERSREAAPILGGRQTAVLARSSGRGCVTKIPRGARPASAARARGDAAKRPWWLALPAKISRKQRNGACCAFLYRSGQGA
ncbi:unnamed protein product [Prorocentrum cordatum]|uniref:Uncharacterized protein n=1 Tax=Prorocentrum cordatum TaxID=2364126 RepID=A0ABN9QYJ6_9DINO|nr:unnamed protein product [Polarella glacialis]